MTSVPPSTSSDLSPMPPPPPPSMLEDLQTELNTNEPDFPMVPPPPPIDEFDLDPMSLRDNLPPPPGEESTSTYTHQPVKPEPPEQFRDRSMTAPNAPRTKPKPKPVAMKGQVRTASEYHAKESPPKAVVLPTPIAQPKQQVANGNSQDTVEVTAASSRGKCVTWLKYVLNASIDPDFSLVIIMDNPQQGGGELPQVPNFELFFRNRP